MGAYLRLYLDDANDLMRLLFEEVAKDKTNDFSYFVDGFMNCKYRRMLDKGYSRIVNMTYDELLSYLHRDCNEIFKEGSFSIDSLQAGWIGRMYNNLQFETKISSVDIYKKLPLDKMMKLFVPLHTTSQEVALEKIMQNNLH